MHCDVLILGAGPAGTSLATHLGRRGFHVQIADRKDFPRAKPCGEFLSPQCTPYLAELGVEEELRASSPWLVRGMHLHAADLRASGRFRAVGTDQEHALNGLGIRRDRFDHLLLQNAIAAGADWLPRHAFAGLLRDADGRVTGANLRVGNEAPRPVTARWVIGADGVHSPIARELGVQRRIPWLDRFALAAHFRGVPATPFAEVHLFADGFFAATTVDDDLFSVNLVVPRQSLRERETPNWDEFVAAHFAAAPHLQTRLAGSERISPWRGIGPMAYTTDRQSVPGAALVGDACGYVDPLTGEGIYFALFGGRELGLGLERAMAQPNAAERAMRDYAAARRREIGPRLRASLWLQRALRHPWLVRSWLRAAGRWPALADLAVTLTGDTAHPRDLLSPSFWRAFVRDEVA